MDTTYVRTHGTYGGGGGPNFLEELDRGSDYPVLGSAYSTGTIDSEGRGV